MTYLNSSSVILSRKVDTEIEKTDINSQKEKNTPTQCKNNREDQNCHLPKQESLKLLLKKDQKRFNEFLTNLVCFICIESKTSQNSNL